ncbi:hypothetical protein ACWKSP_06155 [Micromonosporaceae bacterium Da 78-11]
MEDHAVEGKALLELRVGRLAAPTPVGIQQTPAILALGPTPTVDLDKSPASSTRVAWPKSRRTI